MVPEELGSDFDLEKTLRFGTIPLIWRADDPRRTLEAYASSTCVRRSRPRPWSAACPGSSAGLFHGQKVRDLVVVGNVRERWPEHLGRKNGPATAWPGRYGREAHEVTGLAASGAANGAASCF